MLRLPSFRLLQPASLPEAVTMLADSGAGEAGAGVVRVVAGGTDLWPNMKRRHQKASTVISLAGIPELRGIHANGEVHIGAMESLTAVERSAAVRGRYPALARAVGSISSPVLRNMGTIGGNLCLDTRCTYYNQNEEWRQSISYCMKAAGKICWVAPSSPRCWAVNSSDSAPMLWRSAPASGWTRPPASARSRCAALFHDDGIEYLTKRADEIVTRIVLPAESAADSCRSAFVKLRRRGAIDFGVLSVAVALWMEGGIVREARIVLGSIASFPTPATDAAALLVGKPLTGETIRAAAAQAAHRLHPDGQHRPRPALARSDGPRPRRARPARSGGAPDGGLTMRHAALARRAVFLSIVLLAGCATLFREAKQDLILVNAALSADDVEITLQNAFITTYMNRATIALRLKVEKADPEPHAAFLDGDFHLAGQSAAIGLPVVAEMVNAASEQHVIDRIRLAAASGRPIRAAGAWRLWSEHVGKAEETQGAAIAVLQNASPGHVFELHPLTLIEDHDLRRSFHPIAGYRPGRPETVFRSLEKVPCRIVPKGPTTAIVTRTRQFNDVEFILELAAGRQLEVEDGRFVQAAALDLKGNRLVDRLRMVFVRGTPPERIVRRLKAGDRLHVFGLPRIDLAEVERRLQQGVRNPAALDQDLPYEVVVIGAYPDDPR